MKKHLKQARGENAALKTEAVEGCAHEHDGAHGNGHAQERGHGSHVHVHSDSCGHPDVAGLIEESRQALSPEETVRRTRNLRVLGGVLALNVAMMFSEVGVGLWSSSSALTADGWHMFGHTVALALTFYVMRRLLHGHAAARAGAFEGLVRLERRAGLANAGLLVLLGAFTIFDASRKFARPHVEEFGVALGVAVAGLAVNLGGGWLLHGSHDKSNVAERGMYLHLLSDALMSMLAIVALAAAAVGGWHWADPVVGVLGGLVILKWGASLFAQGMRA